MSQETMKRAKQVGFAMTQEVQDQVENERQRQAKRIGARLQERRRKVADAAAPVIPLAVPTSLPMQRMSAEPSALPSRLPSPGSAGPMTHQSSARRRGTVGKKALMFELHRVNDLIANIAAGPSEGGTPSSRGSATDAVEHPAKNISHGSSNAIPRPKDELAGVLEVDDEQCGEQ